MDTSILQMIRYISVLENNLKNALEANKILATMVKDAEAKVEEVE